MKKFVNKKIAALLATLSVFTSKTQAMDIQKKVNNYQVLDNNFSLSEFNTSKTISTFSQSQASFFIHKPLFLNHPLLEKCFKKTKRKI